MIDACTHIVESGRISDVQMVNAYGRRGNLLHVVQPDRALADFESALRIQPNAPGIVVERAKVYMARHQGDDAIADLSKAIELYPPVRAGIARRSRHRVSQAKGLRARDGRSERSHPRNCRVGKGTVVPYTPSQGRHVSRLTLS